MLVEKLCEKFVIIGRKLFHQFLILGNISPIFIVEHYLIAVVQDVYGISKLPIDEFDHIQVFELEPYL